MQMFILLRIRRSDIKDEYHKNANKELARPNSFRNSRAGIYYFILSTSSGGKRQHSWCVAISFPSFTSLSMKSPSASDLEDH